MSTENMNGTNDTNGTNGNGTPDLGIAPGLSGEYTDPHLKAHRDYESDYAKLALQGGHKGKISSIFFCFHVYNFFIGCTWGRGRFSFS